MVTRGERKERQRVSVACCSCRTRRIRCDGGQPCCMQCMARNVECEYKLKENKRKPPSKRYVESLHARIKILEAQLVSLRNPISDQDGAILNRETHITFESLTEDSDPSTPSTSGEDSLVHQITDTCGRLNLGENGELQFFGPQSNYHLLHETARKTDRNGASMGDLLSLTVRELVDVPLELQEHLLDLYFTWQNPWAYIIPKEGFMRDFYNGNRSKSCTPLLLWSIFSVGARYSDRVEVRTRPDDPDTAGNFYADRAKALLMLSIDTAKISTVQSLALLSIRWMAEDKEAAGWLFSGMATRMAFNLGLHLECAKWVASGLITEEDAEVRKVVWWGCYALDKLFSLGLGRPGNTHDRDITCGRPRHSPSAEFDPWFSCRPKGDSLGCHSRIASTADYQCDHLALAASALDMIYAPNSGLTRMELDGLVSKTDVAMNILWATLPTHLRLPSSSHVPCLPHVYQLHLQYHVAQILLHRPFFARHLQNGRMQAVLDSNSMHLKVCRESASEISRLLQAYRRHYSLRLISIGAVCHTFAAATIHLMDARSSDAEIRQQGIRKLEICTSALREMSCPWSWSRRAHQAIQLLANLWLHSDKKAPDISEEPDLATVSGVSDAAVLADPNDLSFLLETPDPSILTHDISDDIFAAFRPDDLNWMASDHSSIWGRLCLDTELSQSMEGSSINTS